MTLTGTRKKIKQAQEDERFARKQREAAARREHMCESLRLSGIIN